MSEAGLSERALAAHASWFADAARASTAGVRSSRQAEHLAFARDERANIDAALAWSTLHDPAARAGHRQRVRVVLGRARRQPRRTAAPRCPRCVRRPRPRARPSRRAAARGVDRSIDRSARLRSRAHRGGRATGERDRRCRPASPRLLLPRVRRLTRRPVPPSARADRSSQRCSTRISTGRGTRPRTGSSPRAPPSPPATTSAASRRSTRSRTGSRTSMTPGSMSVTRLSVASWPASSTASTMPFCTSVGPLRRHDASASGRPRRTRWPVSVGLSAKPVTTPQDRPPSSSPSPRPRPPVMCAWPRSPVCISAASCAHEGRTTRREPPSSQRSHGIAAVGGGEQAALGECLLAALDGADGVAGAEERLAAVLHAARRDGAAHVEVFALDALARLALDAGDIARATQLCEEADRRMASASHFITEQDRTDAHAVRPRV